MLAKRAEEKRLKLMMRKRGPTMAAPMFTAGRALTAHTVAACMIAACALLFAAVLPAHAGQGLALALLQPLWAQARAEGLRHSALVSVQGSQAYWQRQGYVLHPLPGAAQQARLASYGGAAVYMVRDL